jgi:hypothetical protein
MKITSDTVFILQDDLSIVKCNDHLLLLSVFNDHFLKPICRRTFRSFKKTIKFSGKMRESGTSTLISGGKTDEWVNFSHTSVMKVDE